MTTPEEGFPEPGRRIGPYEIVRQLGMGGMGVVFEAVDTVLDRRVALKVVSPYLADDPAFRVRFTHEAQAQASLDSPHVVQVFAHGETDGFLYIASQLIPDGDLRQMIRASGAPPPEIALDLIAQISAGLADAHATGLVHRDIKPANVLLRIRGQEVAAYLADFGIARRTNADPNLHQTLSTQGFAVGTPSYMAPELHTGGRPGTATDVYSLGCLLWAALVGRAPYVGTTDYQLASAHVSAPIPQLAATGQFEREVNRILRTAMAKHSGERYPAAAAMRDDIRRVLRTHPAPASVQEGSGHEPPTQAPGPARTPTPTPAPPYAVYTPTSSSGQEQPSSPGPRSGLLIGLGLALVLVVVIGVVAAVVLMNNDGGGDDTGRDVDASSASSALSSKATRSPRSTGQDGLSADERRAADNIANVLRADSNFNTLDADCTARKLIEQPGIEGLQGQGLLDEDLNFVGDLNPPSSPEVFTNIISVSVSCVFESVSFPTSN